MSLYTPNSGTDMEMDPRVDDGSGALSGRPARYYVSARSKHPGGVNTVFGDGSVQFASNSISIDVWRALSSMAGDEPISGGGL